MASSCERAILGQQVSTLRQDRTPFWPEKKRSKLVRLLDSWRGRHDRQGLLDGMVEVRVGLQDRSAFVQYQRIGRESCVGISRYRPLPGLTNAVCVDEFALHGIPKAGILQYLDRRFAVGRKLWLGDRDEADLLPG